MLTRQDFELEIGGKFDDFDAVITNPYFGDPPKDYKAEGCGLMLPLVSPDFEKPNDKFFSIGAVKKWKVINNGAAVESEVNPDLHAFTDKSNGGKLFKRMTELIGNGDVSKGTDFFIARGYTMTQAAMYAGLKFHWKSEEYIGVEDKKFPILLPNKYLGEDTSVAATVAPAAGKQAASSDTGELDALVIKNASGKTEKEVKTWAVRDATVSKDTAYMKTLVSGPKLAELERDGKLTKFDGKYV